MTSPPADIDIHGALARRYGQESTDARSREEWVLIREARSGAGFAGNNRQCDLIAINTWASRGLQVVGHEIKVSRTDWLKELKQPAKADQFVRYCHVWWLVVPAPHTKILPLSELPEGWGLLEVNGRGCKIVHDAAKRTPAPVPWSLAVGWLAQRDRLDKRDNATALSREYQRGIEAGRTAAENERLHRATATNARLDQLEAIAKVIDFRSAGQFGLDKRLAQLAALWPLTESYDGINGLLSRLKTTAINGTHITESCNNLRAQLEALLAEAC